MTGRLAVGLGAISVTVGALNYLFQVHAAALLDATAFGLLSSWLVRVSLAGAVATIVQFLSLDFAIAPSRFHRLLRVAGLSSLVILGVHVFLGERTSPVVLGASAVGSGIALYAVIGQLQARLQVGVAAAAGLVVAAIRFGLPFAWPRDARAPAFYVAQSAAAYAGVVAAALFTLRRARATDAQWTARPALSGRVRLGRPFLLAFASVMFPVLDVLVVSTIEDATTTGAFSRVALASRIVFFGGASALQILLPYQIDAAARGKPLPAIAALMQRWLTPATIAGAIVLALLVDTLVLRLGADERAWLYASCLSAAFLVVLLGYVNRFAADDRLGLAGATVAGVVVVSALSAALAVRVDRAVTRYALATMMGDAILLVLACVVHMRPRASSR